MQLLSTGLYAGVARGRDAGGDRPVAGPHLGVETALVVRLPQSGGRATPDVHEYDRCLQFAGNPDTIAHGGLRGG
jgi:hypothetical protein